VVVIREHELDRRAGLDRPVRICGKLRYLQVGRHDRNLAVRVCADLPRSTTIWWEDVIVHHACGLELGISGLEGGMSATAEPSPPDA